MRTNTILLLGLAAFILLRKQKEAPAPDASNQVSSNAGSTPSNDWQDWLPTPPNLDDLSEFWS